MIGHLAAAVKTDLHGRKFPHPVVYAPERVGRCGFDAAIVFARDRSTVDAITAPQGAAHHNPEVPFNRNVAGRFTVYARSPKPGATVLDHEDECDAVCDGVITAMYRILKARRLPLVIVESRMLTRDELRAEADDGAEAADDRSGRRSADFPGCAARVRFTVGTAVRDVTYTGAARLTGTFGTAEIVVIEAPPYPDFDPNIEGPDP